MTSRWSRRIATATAAAAAVAGLVTGPAFGYFTARGSGAGTSGTGSLQPVAILAAITGSPSSLLIPGATADLLLQVHNPNPNAVTLTSVSQGGGVSVTGGSGCTGDPAWPATRGNSGVSVPTTAGQSIPIPAAATVVVQVPGGASMSTTSASGCQGATFQIPVTVVVRQ